MLLHLVAKGEQKAAALLSTAVRAPCVLESVTSGFDGNINVLLAGSLDLRRRLAERSLQTGELTVAMTSSVAGSMLSRGSPWPVTHSLLMNKPVLMVTPSTVMVLMLIVSLCY